MSLSRARALYEQELAKPHADKSAVTLLFVSKWGKKEFNHDQEWIAFLKLCDEQAKMEKTDDYAEICFRIGVNLDLNGFPYHAFGYLIKVEDLVAQKNNSEIPYFFEFHERLGMVYYYFGRNELAKKHFQLIVKQPKAPIASVISANDAIALIYRQKGELESAKYYFEKALNLAKINKREDWIGVLSGNLGNYYYKKGDLKRARELMYTDFEISSKTNQWESAMSAMILLAEIDLRLHCILSAEKSLEQVQFLMNNHYKGIEIDIQYYDAMAKLGEARGDFAMAFRNQQRYLQCLESVQRQQHLENFRNMEFQIAFQKKQVQLKLVEAKKKRVEQTFLLSAIVVCFVILGLIIIIRQIILRKRNEKEIFLLQKLRIEDELKSAEDHMRLILSNLTEKNELINELQNEIHYFTNQYEVNMSSEEKELLSDRLQSFKLLTEDDWDEFRKLFEKRFPHFFDRFQAFSENISKADLRLAALIRLHLSVHEIGRILGISSDSVKRTHLRLRKKMQLDQPKQLDDLIKSL